MLKLIGALLLVGGAWSLGCAAAGRLKKRVRGLGAIVGALELMERELSFRLPPMPELLAHLSERAAPPADLLFAHCRDGLGTLGEISLAQLWREGLRLPQLYLEERERAALDGLGEVLGRYDGEGQRAALVQVRRELEQTLCEARAEQARLSRVYQVLGATAGAMLVILLL